MKRYFVLGAMVVAAAMLAGRTLYAELPVPTLMKSTSEKPKMVSFNLRNDSKASIKVKVGDGEMTLAPGKLTAVKLAVGEKIIAENAGPGYASGDVLQVVSPQMSAATVVLR